MAFYPKPLPMLGLFERWLPLLALIAVIGNHFWFVYIHAINIPYEDDIYDFLQFVNFVEAADGAKGAFSELFKQYIFHRTSASRIFVYAAYLTEGEVNFRTLTLLANLQLLMILLLFYFTVRGERYRWIWLLVSALLLLHLRAHEIVLFSQAAFAYYSVFFFAFGGLFALHKVTVPKFLLAAILCTFSAFSYASGQIVWLVGLASLLHQCFISGRRSLMYPVIWLLVTVAVLFLWKVGYTEYTPPFDVRQIPGNLFDAPFHQVLQRYVAFFLIILGSAITECSTWGAGVAGLILIAILSLTSLRFIRHDDIRLVLCCWFVVASAAAVTFGKAMWHPTDYVLTTRYSFLGVLLLSTLALLVQTKFKLFKLHVVYLVVLLAGTYWVWANRHFEDALQETLNTRYESFNNNHFWAFAKAHADSQAIVRHSILVGIYNPPCRPLPTCESPASNGE